MKMKFLADADSCQEMRLHISGHPQVRHSAEGRQKQAQKVGKSPPTGENRSILDIL
jgi:hypothetical protein